MRFSIRLLTAAMLASFAGCAAPSSIARSQSDVRISGAVHNVDCHVAPQLTHLAERARQIGDSYYPQVVNLIVAPGLDAPRHFDIVFKKTLVASSGGQARETIAYTKPALKTIYLDAALWGAPTNYLGSTSDPEMLGAILIHEMAHIAQQYHSIKRPYWAEGMADYAFFKLGYTNGSFCPECSEQFPDYTSGYSCAGAFLLHLDSLYGPDLVRELNTQLRRNTYSDAFFARYTGKSLQVLWADFQQTRAFTPAAARVNQLRKSMGYADGEPPKDFVGRLNAYIRKQPWASQLDAGLRGGEDFDHPVRSPATLTRMYVYFSEPGGSAYSYLLSLKEDGLLPGILRTDRSWANPSFLDEKPSAEYPAAQTLHFRKPDDSAIFNYTVVRKTEAGPWNLERAWRTSIGGGPTVELQVSNAR